MKNRTFISGNCRFSVISETLIRIEVSSTRKFVDEPTLLAKRRAIPARYSVSESESRLVIETPNIRLTHVNDGNFIHQNNLRAEIVYRDGIVRWFYRKEPSSEPQGIFSRDGWCILEDSGTPVLRDGWLENRPESHKKDFYLFAYGDNFVQALRDLALLSGDFVLPRKSAFGSWYCCERPASAKELLRVVDEYEAYSFPLDVLLPVLPVPCGLPETESVSEPFAAQLKKRGITLALSSRPDGVDPGDDRYADFMRALCCNPETKETLPFQAGDKNYMRAFFVYMQDRPENSGADFLQLDCRCPALCNDVPGIPGQKHLPWLEYLYYEESRKHGLRGQIASSWSGIGAHNRPLCFPAGRITDWESFSRLVKTLVSFAGNGCFFFGMDIGGFPLLEKDPDLYIRMLQFSVTCASLRLHAFGEDAADCRPWLWGEENRDSMRKMFSLRAQLFPYLYSSAYQGYDAQKPLLRPLYYVLPTQEESYGHPDEYFFGDLFLAAPVTEAGQGDNFIAGRDIWLPEGDWVDWFSGQRYQGGRTIHVLCDRDTFPLFVREGFAVPMQPDTGKMTAEPLKNLLLRIFDCKPGRTGVFTLYEDDGRTEEYMDGQFLSTDICYERLPEAVNLSLLPSGRMFDGLVQTRNILIEIIGLDGDYTCDQPKVQVASDPENGRTLVKIGKVNPRAEIHICLKKNCL